jgi:hypothetical protein
MVVKPFARQSQRMTSLDPLSPVQEAATCCRRPMTSIEVTSPLAEGATTLALQTCSACGRHVWHRDGVVLDREAVLEIVRERIAEGPTPRVPRPRSPRPSRARPGVRSS